MNPKLECSNSGSWRVELLAVLSEARDNLLAFLANEPLGKGEGHLGVGRIGANEKVGGVEERVVGLVASRLVDDGLVGQLLVERQDGASVGDGVLLQQDGSGQSLDGECNVLVVPGRVRGGPGNLDFNLMSSIRLPNRDRGGNQGLNSKWFLPGGPTWPIPAHSRVSLMLVADLS